MTHLKRIILGPERLSVLNTGEIISSLSLEYDCTVSRHCALLCLAAAEALPACANGGSESEKTGLYCVVQDPPIEYESIAFLAKQKTLTYKNLRRAVSPMGFLRSMAVAEAGWVSRAFNIRGPLRVFADFTYGPVQALQQASLDFEAGITESALVVYATCPPFGPPVEGAGAYWISNTAEGRTALSGLLQELTPQG